MSFESESDFKLEDDFLDILDKAESIESFQNPIVNFIYQVEQIFS